MENINFLNSVKESQLKKVEVQKVLQQIQKGYWKNQIDDIRYQIQNGNSKKASEIKSNLPAITISATFKERRKIDCVDKYSGLLHLDYDKLENAEEVKTNLISIPYTYSAFISPSGNGVKVLVKCDNDISSHKSAFNSLRDYYDKIVGVQSDKSVKDITRLCFVSYDHDLYLNENSEVFKYKTSTLDQVDLPWIWNFTSNKHEFVVGNRNNFVHSFACNANRYGIDISDTTNFAYSYSEASFPEKEIELTVKSAYENNVNENGSARQTAISAKDEALEVIVDSSPMIPEYIYDALPETLRDACNVFSGRKRDVFLTSALSVISGGLHNVYGLYDKEKVFPNLYSFVIAPPASGKGSMKFAKQLGDCFHDLLFNQSKDELKEYKKVKRLFDRKLKKAKTDEQLEALIEPEKPKSSMFFIPADTSSAMMIKHLEDNDGIGCICETEADTLTNTLKQDWGSYSDVLRKGFHAEIISKSRMTDLDYSEIKEPKFSVAITGTPNQLDALITSIQDGLFSRFIFYSFSAKQKWRSTYTEAITVSNNDIFKGFSADLCDKFRSNNIQKFVMTRKQGMQLDEVFSEALGHNSILYNDDVSGIIYRLGLMTFKIAMTLAALRSDEPEITCSDLEFKTSLDLVEKVYLRHSIDILNKINKDVKRLNKTQNELLNWMKSQGKVKRGDVWNKAKTMDIKERTLADLLRKFLDLDLIKKVNHGVYMVR
jgi:hypothetical protein